MLNTRWALAKSFTLMTASAPLVGLSNVVGVVGVVDIEVFGGQPLADMAEPARLSRNLDQQYVGAVKMNVDFFQCTPRRRRDRRERTAPSPDRRNP